ncbi:MAG TPA: FAD-dependent oxidoreductase, partial [Gemmatimonadales bacterium]|nr:FAD-dependent oxidoreductase [Gemmatimonadales bacterium]
PVWNDAPWRGFAPLAGDTEADVCVVGLGGSGLAAVRELLARGQRVVGLDAGEVGGGAAGRNGGFLLAGVMRFHHDAVAAYGRVAARALYARTLAEVERMARETPAAVRRTGSLRIALSDAERADCARQLEAMRADALPVEPYEGPEGVGLLFPHDCALQPLRRCRTLAERAAATGARLFEHTAALGFDDAADGGVVVRTASGAVRCRAAVVAVDGGLERLLPELAARVRTARLQMLATAPTDEVRVPRPVYARWGYEYWQQLEDGRLALGGFRDLGGDAEWTAEATPTAAVQAALERFLREHLRVRAPVTHRWAASVAYTADGLPVLDEVRPRVWAAGAYSGTGNVVGALCGSALARLACGDADAADEDAALPALLAGARAHAHTLTPG